MTDEIFDDILEYARTLANSEPNKKSMPSTSTQDEQLFMYDLQIPDDIHWKLVALAAMRQLDHETFAEQIIKDFVIKVTTKKKV